MDWRSGGFYASGVEQDAVARVIAIAALAVSIVHVVVNVVTWRSSGARLIVRSPKLDRHPYDPFQHRVVFRIVSSGRLPAVVQAAG
jgi:hypothetical protein